jgi:hypothetical protein
MATPSQFEVAGSHFEVGFAIGERFADRIHCTLDGYALFQQQILPYHRSAAGQARYHQLLDLNRARYPGYMAELEGLAQGAGRAFEDLFLVNMRGEYGGYLRGPVTGCFDCALVTDDVALIGHNEDGSPVFQDNMYLVRAQVKGKPAFTALSYPGFLCGNALGFNAEGVCFSIDNVRPLQTKAGVGRHFIARSLLEARSTDDAVEQATVPGRASGFGYTIGSMPERRVLYLEVSPGAHHSREVHGCYIHANHYQELGGVEQVIGPSSKARMERASAILEEKAPLDAAGVLSILGDEGHAQYPIHRTATPPDDCATFNTVLFDLDARRLRIYTGHPTRAQARFLELAM